MLFTSSLRRRLLSASALASAFSLAALGAQAGGLPTHGHYVSGSGSIGKANQSLTVKQSSTTGIIDWSSFSIGGKNSVSFDNGSGATLNRVTGGNLSTIAGSLHATGSLYLINSSGVIVSGSGHVVTGGSFVATTGDISGGAFDRDRLTLRNPNASVVNKGSIVAGGTATLDGRDVRDSGSIKAAQVSLQATDRLGVDGTVTAKNANGTGGTIIATGQHIALGGHAALSASGSKGGTVLIGGDIHGGAIASDDFVRTSVADAQTTAIAKGARISADASHSTGGNIVIWSDGQTSFAGQISARGQTQGGFAEVSSHDLLAFTGKADLTSAHGATGTLLLDPYNVTISSHANSHESGFTATGDNSVIDVKTLTKALASANVVVSTGKGGSQTGNITVDAAIAWSSASTLSLDAYDNVIVKDAITNTGKGNLFLRADSTGTGKGTVEFSGSGEVNFAKSKGAVIILYNPSDNPAGSGVNTTSYTSPDNFSSHVKTNHSVSGQMLALMLVNTVYDLQNMQNNADGDYALGRDIDASATKTWNENTETSTPYYEGFIPIAPSGFFGIFDGLGHSIKDLYEDAGVLNTQAGGLFGELSASGLVTDVTLSDVSMTFGGNAIFSGALVGYNEGGIVSNSASSGKITYAGGNSVGGLVGENDGTVTKDRSSVALTATSSQDGNSAGGLVGLNYGFVESSHATGVVTDKTQNANVGGLVGFNNSLEGVGYIDDSYATGAVTGGSSQIGGGSNVGGLVGYNIGQGSSEDDTSNGSTEQPGEIVASYATGKVTDSGTHAFVGGLVGDNDQDALLLDDEAKGTVVGGSDGITGGLVGANDGVIDMAYETGTVSAGIGEEVGGLVGLNADEIEKSYAIGAVTAGSADNGENPYESNAGGLVGRNQGQVVAAYATGHVTVGKTTSTSAGAIAYAGGLIGDDYGGTLDQVYSTGKVSGGSKSRIGGLSGRSGASAKYAYWDTSTSDVSKSAEGTARTTSQLKGKLPAGFSTKDWKIEKTSLPYLAWQKSNIPKVQPPTVVGASEPVADVSIDAFDNEVYLNSGVGEDTLTGAKIDDIRPKDIWYSRD